MSMTLKDIALPRQARPVPATPSNVLEQFSMKGKVVAITGASDGIGWAVAEAVAEAGGNLALWYNTNDAAVARGAELAKKCGVSVRTYQVEISDSARVRQAVDDVVQDFGKVDVFVANAGMVISKGALDTSIEEYKKQLSVNGASLQPPKRPSIG